jgi:hypothetical protein
MLHKLFFSKTVAGIAIALFLAGCDKEEDKKVALSSIEVTPAQVELTTGGTQQLIATAVPKDAADVVFEWSSADNTVVTVSDKGLVTAVKAGNTTVKVASGGIEKSVPVKVVAAFTPALEVTPADPEQALAAGGALELAVAANADWTYSLSADAEAWLTASKTSAALTLTVAPNAATEVRNATVTFSLTDYSAVTQTVTVSQAANTIAMMNEADFGPGVTPSVLTATGDDLKSTLEGLTAGNYVVNITENVTLNAATGGPGDKINITLETKGVTISLRGSGNNTITPANDANIVRINEGKLILRNVTLSKTGAEMPTVSVGANGELVIYEGVSIVGSGGSNNSGVRVEEGHFLMKGGEIRGHRTGGGGAGVFLTANGAFQMDGGKIYDNTAGYGGGVFINSGGGSFIMNGGELYDNHSTDAGEGGGAVYIWQTGHAEIHSGAIVYGENGNGGSKAGNTAASGAAYGHAVTAFYTASSGKYRSTTIQNENLSITLSAGAETESSGTWIGF